MPPSDKPKGLVHAMLRGRSKAVAPSVERRRKLRMRCSYPATVRGRDAHGRTFETGAVLDDLSACGLSLRLRRSVPAEMRLFILVHFSPPSQLKSTKPIQGIAVRGVVRRLAAQPDGTCEVGVEFRRHRFVDIANEHAYVHPYAIRERSVDSSADDTAGRTLNVVHAAVRHLKGHPDQTS